MNRWLLGTAVCVVVLAIALVQLSNRESDDGAQDWNGGSWVFVLTRDSVEVLPLPDRDLVEERVAVFQGLLERRDELEREAGAIVCGDHVDNASINGAMRSGRRAAEAILQRG